MSSEVSQRRLIDPVSFGKIILHNVYDPEKNTRMVYKFRCSASYGGSVAIDLMGCSYRCPYCWVHTAVLTGGGSFIEILKSRGQKLAYTPREAAIELQKYIKATKTPSIQITGAETFLTPSWTLELIVHLNHYLTGGYPYRIPQKYDKGLIWVDSQGFDLMKHEWLFAELAKYRKRVRLFISLKAHPNDYAKTTGVDPQYAETPFLALELAWQFRIIAIPQMLDNLFRPERMEWLFERLSQIHPNAPRVLEFDRLRLFPWRKDQNMERMKHAGFRFGKNGDIVPRRVALKAWQETLVRHYGAGVKVLNYPKRLDYFDADTFPRESSELVEKLIFES